MNLAFRHPHTCWHLLVLCVCSATLMCTSRAEAFSDDDSNPAVITNDSREPLIQNDFLRITFVPSDVPVTTPSRPTAPRTFFGATRFYEPPLPVATIADFNGFAANAEIDLVAMRCRPPTATADPHLATWPQLATMIKSDFAGQQYSCPPPPSPEAANVAFCLAQQYTDTAGQPVVTALIAALQFGQQLFQLGSFLGNAYGIDPDHSGLGFVVRGPAVVLNAADVLEQSVVPEYLLLNSTLAALNCRCIRVARYSGRDQDVLPAELIWKRGTLDPDGVCSQYVNRLPRGQ